VTTIEIQSDLHLRRVSSYNNERSGILTFVMYPCLESAKIKNYQKTR